MNFGIPYGNGRVSGCRLGNAMVFLAALTGLALGATQNARADQDMEIRIRNLGPALDAYVTKGMKDFDDPGLAIGIVTSDKLYFRKGYGVRKKGGEPVDTSTVFQIGSTTKAFLATTMAIAADRGKLAWDDRIVDLDNDFEMKDPWVTREFRVSDILAQRSGMPPSANDVMGMLGFDQAGMVRAMRFVEPVSSFRSTFAYTNVTHMLAQRIVARQFGSPDWDSVVRSEIFEPLGMKSSSFTAEAIEAAPNHTEGYRWTPQGAVEVPFTPIFPYGFGAAGAINSTIEDLGPWVRLHLANGKFEGREIVSAQNLAVTKTPRTAVTDRLTYAMGWVVQSTENGRIIWHNGGTTAYGAFIGMAPDKDVGVIVLTNETNVGLPDAIGEWVLDRLMGNPEVDHVAERLKGALAGYEQEQKVGAEPAVRQPATVLPPLAGDYVNASVGHVKVSEDGPDLAVEIAATGANLKLEDQGGQVFAVTLVGEGRFAGIAENLGPTAIGVAQFEVNQNGMISGFTFISGDNGQRYPFTRQ